MDHLGWNDWFYAAGIAREISPTRGKRAANVSLAMALTEQGAGAALAQSGLARNAERAGRLCISHSTAVPLSRPYCAITRDALAAEGEIARMIEILQE